MTLIYSLLKDREFSILLIGLFYCVSLILVWINYFSLWTKNYLPIIITYRHTGIYIYSLTCLTGHLCLTVTLRPAQLILLYNSTLFNSHLSNVANGHLFHAWIVRCLLTTAILDILSHDIMCTIDHVIRLLLRNK